jgi:excisionase family DNA binding protein
MQTQQVATETDGSEFFSPIQVSRILGISRPTIYKLIKRGLLKARYLTPRACRISKSDLLAYLRNCETGGLA